MRQLKGDKNKILSNHPGFTPSACPACLSGRRVGRLNLRQAGVRLSRNLTGFTLIELLVSIFIVALISSIFMVNYRGADKRSGLNMTKQKLASDIRLAQNYSLGSKTYNATDTPTGGWGVHFDKANPSQYIIFADGGVVAGDPDGNHEYDDGEGMEIKHLTAGVTINFLKYNDDVPKLDIIFFPPDPAVYINTRNVFNRPANSAIISLIESTNNSTATVEVNFFGLIDAQ